MRGTVFLWFGWFGFNAGSALGANLRAAIAFLVTNLAGCTGAMTWIFMDWRLERKWSVVGVFLSEKCDANDSCVPELLLA